jgi:hypothetical protein
MIKDKKCKKKFKKNKSSNVNFGEFEFDRKVC